MKIAEVRKMFSDPAFLADYDKWKNDPMTKAIFEAAGLMARAIPLSHPAPESALYQYGELVGMERILSFVRDADEVVSAIEQAEADAAYGASEAAFLAAHPHIAAARRRRTNATKAPAA